jgi:hypothetical protein
MRSKEQLNRGYLHIKFTATRGGTELGVKLDNDECDFSAIDFAEGTGRAKFVGQLMLNYVKVTCFADIDVSTFEGTGHLQPLLDLGSTPMNSEGAIDVRAKSFRAQEGLNLANDVLYDPVPIRPRDRHVVRSIVNGARSYRTTSVRALLDLDREASFAGIIAANRIPPEREPAFVEQIIDLWSHRLVRLRPCPSSEHTRAVP